MRDTGFLLRSAGRNTLLQYDETARAEQAPTSICAVPRIALPRRAGRLRHSRHPSHPEPRARSADRALSPRQGAARSSSAPGLSALPQRPHFTDSGSGNPTLDHRTAFAARRRHLRHRPLSRQAQPDLRPEARARPACLTPQPQRPARHRPLLPTTAARHPDEVIERKVRFPQALRLPPPTDRRPHRLPALTVATSASHRGDGWEPDAGRRLRWPRRRDLSLHPAGPVGAGDRIEDAGLGLVAGAT